MPTYTEQGGEIYTAPGLVPGFYGVVIAAAEPLARGRAPFGRRASPAAAAMPSRRDDGNSNARLALAAGLGLFFIVGLIGRMPFWLAAAIFVTAFIAPSSGGPGSRLGRAARRLATALLQGVVTGIAVTLVFESVFLVRLP